MNLNKFYSEEFKQSLWADERIREVVTSLAKIRVDSIIASVQDAINSEEEGCVCIDGYCFGRGSDTSNVEFSCRKDVITSAINAVVNSKSIREVTKSTKIARFMLSDESVVDVFVNQSGIEREQLEELALGEWTYPKDMAVTADEVYEILETRLLIEDAEDFVDDSGIDFVEEEDMGVDLEEFDPTCEKGYVNEWETVGGSVSDEDGNCVKFYLLYSDACLCQNGGFSKDGIKFEVYPDPDDLYLIGKWIYVKDSKVKLKSGDVIKREGEHCL